MGLGKIIKCKLFGSHRYTSKLLEYGVPEEGLDTLDEIELYMRPYCQRCGADLEHDLDRQIRTVMTLAITIQSLLLLGGIYNIYIGKLFHGWFQVGINTGGLMLNTSRYWLPKYKKWRNEKNQS